uniref:Uncharacterized protein n=1 Tax=Glossina pallidipes TaxID=7398 RepID=A0A1A9ZR69_GLOPL
MPASACSLSLKSTLLTQKLFSLKCETHAAPKAPLPPYINTRPKDILLHKLSCVTLEFLYSVCFTRNIFYTLFDVLKLPMDVKPMHSLMHAYISAHTSWVGNIDAVHSDMGSMPYAVKSKTINIHALGNTENDTHRHTFSCSLNEHFRCLSSGGHGNRNSELFEIYKCNGQE